MEKDFEYKKTICFVNKRLTRYFKCNWFQIYPLEDYINSEIKTTHFPFVLEYKVYKDDIKKISYQDFEDKENEFLSKISHENQTMNYILKLLSVVTNYYFFVYNFNDQGWFTNLDGKKEEDFFCKYGAKLYYDTKLNKTYFPFIKDFTELNFKEVEYVNHSKYYQFPDIDEEEKYEVKMGDNTLEFFNSLENLSELQKKYFDSAITLIYNGCEIRKQMKSLALISFISSIETMTALEAKINKEEVEIECHSCKSIKDSKYKCKSCGKPIWGISQQIKNYLNKYLSPDEKLKRAINKLYGRRSQIAHAGNLLSGDIFFDWNDSKKREEHYHELIASMQYSKMSLVNYLLLNKN